MLSGRKQAGVCYSFFHGHNHSDCWSTQNSMLLIVHWRICMEIITFILSIVLNYGKKLASEDHSYFWVICELPFKRPEYSLFPQKKKKKKLQALSISKKKIMLIEKVESWKDIAVTAFNQIIACIIMSIISLKLKEPGAVVCRRTNLLRLNVLKASKWKFTPMQKNTHTKCVF